MFKKSVLFVLICAFLAFQGLSAKEGGSCQGHPTCEKGDK